MAASPGSGSNASRTIPRFRAGAGRAGFLALILAALGGVPMLASGDEVGAPDPSRVEKLERRVEELERERDGAPATAPAREPGFVSAALDRFHLSGNADLHFLYGESNSRAPDGRFVIDNARLFLDVDLAGRDDLGDSRWLEEASLYLEWDLYRHTAFLDDIGSLYVRLDHLGGLDALNLKVGRVAIPFGVEYTRWSEARPENPLLGFSAAQPYGWDEGLMLFGSLADGLVDYRAAILDGDASVGVNSQATPSFAGTLRVSPLDWLHASASGYTSGKLGQVGRPNQSALILAAAPFPPLSTNPYSPQYPGPGATGETWETRIDGVDAWELDLTLDVPKAGTQWLGYGEVQVNGYGEPITGRRIRYGVAEGVLDWGVFDSSLDRFYVAARYSFVGTFEDHEGYLFVADDDGHELAFDTKLVEIAELGFGVRITRQLQVKAEYASYDFSLIDGASSEERAAARHRSYGGIGLSASF